MILRSYVCVMQTICARPGKLTNNKLLEGNEKEVGQAIKDSGVPREELFITTKLWNTCHRPELVQAAFEKSLENLQLEYLDLYLMHW